jgi:hypothetical protein
MEEARAVLARLERIEALERARAPVPVLLAEVRALLHEAEAWVRAEPLAAGPAEEALRECRAALRGLADPDLGPGRTLLA